MRRKIAIAMLILLAPCAAARGQAERGDGGRIVIPVPKRVVSVALEGMRLACLLQDGNIFILDATDGRLIDKAATGGMASSIAIDPSGFRVAIAGIAGLAAPGPEKAPRFDLDLNLINSRISREVADRFYGLAVTRRPPSANGELALDPIGGFMELRTVPRMDLQARVEVPAVALGLCFGPGKGLTLVDSSFSVYKYDDKSKLISAWRSDFEFLSHQYPSPQVVFGGDGSKVACLSDGSDGKIAILSCDIGTGERCTHRRPPRSSAPWAIAAAPDGRSFATCGRKGSIALWGFGSNAPPRELEPDGDEAADMVFIAFGRDSRSIITADSEGIVRVRDVVSGRQVFTARGVPRHVRVAALDGGRLVLVSGGYRPLGAKIEPLSLRVYKLDSP